jgi:hypothetical protein
MCIVKVRVRVRAVYYGDVFSCLTRVMCFGTSQAQKMVDGGPLVCTSGIVSTELIRVSSTHSYVRQCGLFAFLCGASGKCLHVNWCDDDDRKNQSGSLSCAKVAGPSRLVPFLSYSQSQLQLFFSGILHHRQRKYYLQFNAFFYLFQSERDGCLYVRVRGYHRLSEIPASWYPYFQDRENANSKSLCCMFF